MTNRTRKQVKEYRAHRKYVERPDEMCAFCAITTKSPQTIKYTPSFKLIRNIFPYSVWDNFTVTDHLLLAPKQHTDTLAGLPAKVATEYVKIISEYESKGYNVYARTPGSGMKSITHQHTHLIKPGKKPIKALFYWAKPHLRWVLK